MTHLDHTTRALIATVRASLTALRAATADMRQGGGPAALKRAIEEADVLSGAVSRLDKLIDNLAGEPSLERPREVPVTVEIGDVTELLRRLRLAAGRGCCAHCGGVIDGPDDAAAGSTEAPDQPDED